MIRRFASLCAWGLVCSLTAASVGCDEETQDADGDEFPEPTQLPPLSKAPTTAEERLIPTHPVSDGSLDPRTPEHVDQMLSEGYGDYTMGPGEPTLIQRTPDASPAAPAGPNAGRLARFVHLADIQLTDDESTARVSNFDSPMGPTSGAFRPQDGHGCKILNATVRTINRVHQDDPIDCLILGGDNADNAQTNEVDWVLAILSGSASVECDSGDDNDPEPGPENDPKDPFYADGLTMPWIWVTGNHDVLNQGNFPPLPLSSEYTEGYASKGTRDWASPGGPVFLGDVPADPQRIPLSGSELLAKVRADGDGHGVSEAAVASGRAFYSYDVANTPLRVIVIDTAAPTGSAEGLLRQSEIDGFLKPELDRALTEQKLVVVTSHHSSARLTDGGEFGGAVQADAVMPDEFRELLGDYPNLLMHLAGHTHVHRVTQVLPSMGTPYWEVETSAIADFPHQIRLFELWDLDNGFYGLRSLAVDYQTEADPIAEDGRRRGIMDMTSGWQEDGTGVAADRNFELYVPKP